MLGADRRYSHWPTQKFQPLRVFLLPICPIMAPCRLQYEEELLRMDNRRVLELRSISRNERLTPPFAPSYNVLKRYDYCLI